MLIIRKRFFHGWAVVGALFLVGFAEVVAFNPILALMMKPMAAETGWSRAAIVGALSAGSVASGAVSILVGPILDRKGARWVLAVGIAVMGVCLISISQVTALWQFYLLFGLNRAISAGIVEMSISVAIANWFINKRSRAIGIVTTGPRIGLACIPPLALLFMSWSDWRGAWVGLGLTSMLIGILPTILFIGRRPEDYGMLPDGGTQQYKPGHASSHRSPSPEASNIKKSESSWTVRRAVGSTPFWLLTAGQAIATLASGGVNMHQLPHLTDRGIAPAVAVGAISSYAIWAMVGVLAFSFLAERWGARRCLTVSLGLSAIGVFILARVDSVAMAYFYSAFYGLMFGGEMALFPLAWADYFGRASLGTIRGISRPIVMVFNAGGPFFGGWVYDTTGSYGIAFVVFIIAFLVGAILIFTSNPARPSRAK